MAPLQRNKSVKLSIMWDPRCVTSSGSNTTRRSAISWSNVKGVMIATVGEATSIIVTTKSGRIVITAVIITTMTSTERNRRTRLLLIAATRHSSHALWMDQRASFLPLRSATRIPTIKTSIKLKTKNVNIRHTATVTTMSPALVSTYRSQVKTRCQPQARAKTTRMRTIIFLLIWSWRPVAMCLAGLTINSIGASPSQAKRIKQEKLLLYSWMTISILWTLS